MRSRKRSWNSIAAVVVIVFALSTISVFAASTTLMTYDGTEIRNKQSVSTFKLSGTSKITLNHKTTKWTGKGDLANNECKITINLLKKGSIGYSETGDVVTYIGLNSTSYKTKSWTKGSGTYRLHFKTGTTRTNGSYYYPGADIKGNIKK